MRPREGGTEERDSRVETRAIPLDKIRYKGCEGNTALSVGKSRLSGILPLPQIPKSGLVLCWGHVQAHKDGSISATRCRASSLKLDVN